MSTDYQRALEALYKTTTAGTDGLVTSLEALSNIIKQLSQVMREAKLQARGEINADLSKLYAKNQKLRPSAPTVSPEEPEDDLGPSMKP